MGDNLSHGETPTMLSQALRLALQNAAPVERPALVKRAYAPLPSRRCCAKAVRQQCVCAESWTCPDHGTKCHGTHD